MLLDAKRASLFLSSEGQVDRPAALGFHLAAHCREAVLKLAGSF